MIVYLGIYGVLGVLGLTIRGKDKYVVLILLWVFLVWFMGARFDTGCDFYGYFRRFLAISQGGGDVAKILAEPEPGLQLITYWIREMGGSYMWVNIVASMLIVTCFLIFCGYHHDSLMIGALLFPVMLVQLGMSGLRQAIACGFILIASIYFMKGSPIKTAFWIFVAAQFHSSAVIFMPLAVLAGREVKLSTLIGGLFLMLPVVLFLMGDRAEVYQERYGQDGPESNGALIRYVLVIIPAVLFLMNRKMMKAFFPSYYYLFLIFAMLTVLLLPIGLVNTVVLHRLIYYVMPFTILIFVFYCQLMFVRRKSSEYRVLPFALYGLYTLTWFSFSFHADRCYLPYQNFLLI